MVLHLSHAQGGFDVTFNDITKDTFLHYYFTFCGLAWSFLSGTSDLVVDQGRPQGLFHMVSLGRGLVLHRMV